MKKEKWRVIKCLTYLLLVTSCLPIDNEGIGNELPSGTGSFTLKLADKTARTVLPDTPYLDYFTAYKLIFTPILPAGADLEFDLGAPDASGKLEAVVLSAGQYELEVVAYTGGTVITGTVAARGFKDNIVISLGVESEENVTLKALLNEGAGTFSWNITINTTEYTVSTATMNVYPAGLSMPITGLTDVDLLPSPSTGTYSALNSGLYDVKFHLVAPNKDVVWYELLHIYATLTSEAEITFTDAYFRTTHYVVTFNHNYAGAPVPGSQSYLHGDTIANGGAPADPVRGDGWRFTGWFKDSDCTDEWDINNDKVLDNITLYAGWIRETVTITLDIESLVDAKIIYGGAPVTLGTITLSRTGTVYPDSKKIEVDLGAYDTGSVKWELDTVGLSPTTIVETTAEFTINATDVRYNSLGGHLLRLTVEIDGIQYQINIPFTIVE